MPSKILLSLAALLIVTLIVGVYLSAGKQSQFAMAQQCVVGGPNLSPIENARDRANANKASRILWNVKDEMSLHQPSKFCAKKIKEAKDGLLDCYLMKSIEHDEFVKICFSPRGALFSLEFQE